MEHKDNLTFDLCEDTYTLDIGDCDIDIELNDAIKMFPGKEIYYEGDYVVTPDIVQQKLATQYRFLEDDVTVLEIPYHEVSNLEGTTVIIGGIKYNGIQ